MDEFLSIDDNDDADVIARVAPIILPNGDVPIQGDDLVQDTVPAQANVSTPVDMSAQADMHITS